MDNHGPSSARYRLRRGLFPNLARLVVLLLPTVTTGCICLAFGGREQRDSEEPFTQNGKVMVQQGQELDVYYPVPYASPPNLQIDDTLNVHVIVDQQADHFRLRNAGFAKASAWPGVEWTARGMRAPTPSPATPAPTAAPAQLSPPTATQTASGS
jgi:hypothetical protein